jgi:hypothetical protein
VSWTPCGCAGGDGHLRVRCAERGCRSVWYQPPHVPGTEVTGCATGPCGLIWSAVTRRFLQVVSALLLCEAFVLAPELPADPQRGGEAAGDGKTCDNISPGDHPVDCFASLMNFMGSVLPGGAC